MLKTRITLWGILLGLCAVGASAQNLLSDPLRQSLYGRFGEDRLFGLAQNWRGDIGAVGLTHRGTNGGEDIFFVLLRPNLEKKAEIHLGRANDDAGFGITAAPDGRFWICGSSRSPQGKTRARYFGKQDGWLLTLNEEGKNEEEFIWGTPEDDYFLQVFPLKGGDKLIVGNSGQAGWLLRINPQNEVVWEKKLQYHRLPTTVQRAALFADQTVYLVGFALEEGASKMWMAAVDTAGRQVWDKIFPAADAKAGAGIAVMDGPRLLVTGYLDNDRSREQGFVYQLDGQGNALHYQVFGQRENDQLVNLLPLLDGNFALVGSSNSFQRGSRRPTIWVLKCNPQGELLQESYYGSKTYDEGQALTITHDGELLALGISYQQVLKSAQGWVGQIGNPPSKREQAKVNPNLRLEWGQLSASKSLPAGNLPRYFLPWRFTGVGTTGLSGLRARLRLNGTTTVSPMEVQLPAVPPGVEHQWYYLPLPYQQWQLPPGIYPLEVQLLVNDQALGPPQVVLLPVGQPDRPILQLAAEQWPSGLSPGSSLGPAMLVRNLGTQVAKKVHLEFSSSPGLLAPAPVEIGDVEPGATRRITLPISIRPEIQTDSLWLRVRAVDGPLEAVTYTDLSAPLIRANAENAPKSNAQYLTAIWMHPNPDQFEGKTIVWPEPTLEVQVKALSSQVLDKQHFCLEINGQPCTSGKKMDEVSLKGAARSRTFLQTINLQEGPNTLRAVVTNDAGTQSTELLKVVYSPRKPNLHLISIGVPSVDLKYTHKDARDFALGMLGSPHRPNQAFGEVFLDTLNLENNTTKTNILKTLKRLQYRFYDRQIAAQDLVVVFISSHGINTAEGAFHIAASDYDGPFLAETSLNFEQEVLDYLKTVACRKLFLIDACHSGAGAGTGPNPQLSTDQIAQLSNYSRGQHLILSCRANELSYEDDQWQNGAFTRAILNGFAAFAKDDPQVDANRDGALDLQELYQYLEKEVPRLLQTKRPKPNTSQQPLLVADNRLKPLILFQLPPKK